MTGGLRVFVVDDDQTTLYVLAGMLQGACELETFSSAEACLARLAEVKPDLFLLDISMPVMDGYALCRRLKDDWETQDIPVLFVSA